MSGFGGDWMSSVLDSAAYILGKRGAMTTMKLQKLVYYSQAWSLVWDEEPLFSERIEAWANGPVCPVLYDAHRGVFRISEVPQGDSSKLNVPQRETIDAVLEFYGPKSAWWLSDLTHQESPWINARKNLSSGERGNKEITHAEMAEYYAGLTR